MTSLFKSRFFQLCAFVLAGVAGTSPFWLFNSDQPAAIASDSKDQDSSGHDIAVGAASKRPDESEADKSAETPADRTAAGAHATSGDKTSKGSSSDSNNSAEVKSADSKSAQSKSADSMSDQSKDSKSAQSAAVTGADSKDSDGKSTRDGKSADKTGADTDAKAKGADSAKGKDADSNDDNGLSESKGNPGEIISALSADNMLEETVIEEHQADARGVAGTIDIKGTAKGSSDIKAQEVANESSVTGKKDSVSAGKADPADKLQAKSSSGKEQKKDGSSGQNGSDESKGKSGGNDGKGEDQSAQTKGQSLEQKVKALTESQTREQKDAYERSLEERHEQVESAIASIAENSRMYLPPLISSRALVVYYPAPSIDSRRTPNSSRVDAVTGPTSVKIDGKAEPAIAGIARTISNESGARLYQINAISSYPKKGYELYEYALNELNTKNYPELTDDEPLHMEDYDTVYLCYPLWWDDLPGAMYSFLIKYDLSDKNIIPVIIHAGDGFAATLDNIATYEPNAVVYRQGLSFSINENLEDDHFTRRVRQFLTRLSTDFN